MGIIPDILLLLKHINMDELSAEQRKELEERLQARKQQLEAAQRAIQKGLDRLALSQPARRSPRRGK